MTIKIGFAILVAMALAWLPAVHGADAPAATSSRLPGDAAEAIVISPEEMVNPPKRSGGTCNGTLVPDPKAPTGKAVFFRNADKNSYTPSMWQDLKPGRYRFTVSARHERGNKFKLSLGFGGTNFRSGYTFFFGANRKDQSYQQQSVDLVIPGKGWVHLQGAKYQTGEMIERIVITPLPSDTLVEVLDVETDKLVYRPGELPRMKVSLRNSAAAPVQASLRVTIENGVATETVVAEQPVELKPASGVVPVELALKAALPEWGTLVRAELLVGGKVVAGNRTACAVSEQPFRVGQYGIIGGDAPYEAAGIEAYIDEFRRTYCSAVEIAFWAPCDMSLMTPPAGKDRWWSGQTLRKMSTGQMRTYARRLHDNGMAFLGYATYANVFSHRVYDWGRSFPEGLDWNAIAQDKFIWSGWGQDRMRLGSPARSEDDTLTGLQAKGVARTLHTQPIALQRHADQLVGAMKEFGLDGFRYDDNLDYAGEQVDIFGRRGPFPGWGLDEIFTYFRQRLHAANPKALFGHNSDPMRTGGDAMYAKSLEYPEVVDNMEAAIFRDGSLALQEAFTKAPGGKTTWVQWRDRNEVAGRSAHKNGGVLASITSFGGEPKSMTAMMLASGNRVAYSGLQAHRPYLAFATRYSQFLYSADLRWLSKEEAGRTVSVEAAGREVWWQPWVRFLPTASGKRVYLVHLVNPPAGETFADSDLPDPVKGIAVTLKLPQGWKAQRAWQLSADHDEPSGEIVRGKLVAGVPTAGDSGKVEVAFASGQTGATALKLEGRSLSVPALDCWSLIAIECDGPTGDVAPSDIRPTRPAPTVPALQQPTAVERATEIEPIFLTWEAGQKVLKPGTPLEMRLGIPMGQHGAQQTWPMGRYRVTVRYIAAKGASGSLTCAVLGRKSGATPKDFKGEPRPAIPAFETKAEWPLAATAPGKAGVLRQEMTWGEMPDPATVTFTADKSEISLTGLQIECLARHDIERLKLWQNGWAAGTALPQSGLNIWIGEGLYAEYFGLDKVLAALPGAQVKTGLAWSIGQQWGGLGNSLGQFQDHNLIVLGDVAIWRWSPSRLDQLRGWVEAGGRLVMTGGPHGFGRGSWHLSDLMQPLYPAELGGAFDLQPVGVNQPAVLTPVSPLAKKIDFSGAPAVMWQHVMKAKPDATVHVTAGGQPVIITRPYGKGKVCFIALAPLGDAPAGKTAFWDWKQWPELMQAVVEDTLR
jgi:hypothetical protein